VGFLGVFFGGFGSIFESFERFLRVCDRKIATCLVFFFFFFLIFLI
jgi:hypothetical protein